MPSHDVFAVLDALGTAGVGYRVDGGWGVDVLVGRETRKHSDLDLVIERADLRRAADALRRLGYTHDAAEQPGLPARFVLRAPDSRQVDLHPVVLDENGDGWQELGGGEWGRYTSDGLEGRGELDGRPIPCITAELQLAHHAAHEHDEADRHDVELLEQLLGRR